jgi:serine/threonine-protein phosphatase 2A regulatory subunit B'
MVYNAMKLFMEVNPQLFDDCSHDYAEQQTSLLQKQQARSQRWSKLEDLAKGNGNVNGRIPPPLATTTGQGTKVLSPRTEDGDPLSQERRNLEGLRLGDDAAASASGSSSGSRASKKEASTSSVS